MIDEAPLPLDGSTKDTERKLQQFIIVFSGNEAGVGRFQALVDGGQEVRNFSSVESRDLRSRDACEVQEIPLWFQEREDGCFEDSLQYLMSAGKELSLKKILDDGTGTLVYPSIEAKGDDFFSHLPGIQCSLHSLSFNLPC